MLQARAASPHSTNQNRRDAADGHGQLRQQELAAIDISRRPPPPPPPPPGSARKCNPTVITAATTTMAQNQTGPQTFPQTPPEWCQAFILFHNSLSPLAGFILPEILAGGCGAAAWGQPAPCPRQIRRARAAWRYRWLSARLLSSATTPTVLPEGAIKPGKDGTSGRYSRIRPAWRDRMRVISGQGRVTVKGLVCPRGPEILADQTDLSTTRLVPF